MCYRRPKNKRHMFLYAENTFKVWNYLQKIRVLSDVWLLGIEIAFFLAKYIEIFVSQRKMKNVICSIMIKLFAGGKLPPKSIKKSPKKFTKKEFWTKNLKKVTCAKLNCGVFGFFQDVIFKRVNTLQTHFHIYKKIWNFYKPGLFNKAYCRLL